MIRLLQFFRFCVLCILYVCSKARKSPSWRYNTTEPKDMIRGVHYISWVEPYNKTLTNLTDPGVWDWNSRKGALLEDITNADDLYHHMDLTKTSLLGKFPFLGVQRTSMDIGSNGYLQFDSSNCPPCVSSYFALDNYRIWPLSMCFMSFWGADMPISFQSTYFGVIAIFLTDLYPGAGQPYARVAWNNYTLPETTALRRRFHRNAHVQEAVDRKELDGVIIHYIGVPFYNASFQSNVTARARLQRNGHVTIFWDDLGYDPAKCGFSCQVEQRQAGIRDSVHLNSSSFLHTGTMQQNIAKINWKNQVPGVYPPSSASVQNSTLFHMCPFSDAWCMRPNLLAAAIDLDAATTASQAANAPNVTFRTLSFSCQEEFSSYACLFSTADSTNPLYGAPFTPSYVAAATSGLAVASSVATVMDNTRNLVFMCKIPPTVLSTKGKYLVSLLAVFDRDVNVEGTMKSYVSLIAPAPLSSTIPSYQADTLPLEIVDSTDPKLLASNQCSATVALNVTTDLEKAPANGDIKCGVCALCNNLVEQCILDSGKLACNDTLVVPDCKGYCSNLNSTMVTRDIHYDMDTLTFPYTNFFGVIAGNQCCDEELLDCSGRCNEGRKIAQSVQRAEDYNKHDGSPLYPNVCCDKRMLNNQGQCCYNTVPDCAGTCGGPAKIDCMGVCNGPATTGPRCLQPTAQPSVQPTCAPTISQEPTLFSQYPTSRPSGQPSMVPSSQPSSAPTSPTGQPTARPSGEPSGQPTCQPSIPTGQPTSAPTGQPTQAPFGVKPTQHPTVHWPTGKPTGQPSGHPSGQPSTEPTSQPTSAPTSCVAGPTTGNVINACGDCLAPGSYGYVRTYADASTRINVTRNCQASLNIHGDVQVWASVSYQKYLDTTAQDRKRIGFRAGDSNKIRLHTQNYFPVLVSVSYADPGLYDPSLTFTPQFIVPCCGEIYEFDVYVALERVFAGSTITLGVRGWEPKRLQFSVTRAPNSGFSTSNPVSISSRSSIILNPQVTDCSAVPPDNFALCGLFPHCIYCLLGNTARVNILYASSSWVGNAPYEYAQNTVMEQLREEMGQKRRLYMHADITDTSQGAADTLVEFTSVGTSTRKTYEKESHPHEELGPRRRMFLDTAPPAEGFRLSNLGPKVLGAGSPFTGVCTSGISSSVCAAASFASFEKDESAPAYKRSPSAAVDTTMFTVWKNGSVTLLVYITIGTLGFLGLYLLHKIQHYEHVEMFFDMNGRHVIPMGQIEEPVNRANPAHGGNGNGNGNGNVLVHGGGGDY